MRGHGLPIRAHVDSAAPPTALAAPSAASPSDASAPNDNQATQVGLVVGGAEYTVVAAAQPNGTALQLLRSDGAWVLARHFESQDCGALAAAIAVVVEAYFVEMKGLSPEANAAPASPLPNGNAGIGTTNGAVSSPEPQPVAQAPNSAPKLTPGAAGRTTDDRLAIAMAPGDRRTIPLQPIATARAMAGLGFALAAPTGELGPGVNLRGGVDVTSVPVAVELAAATAWPTTSGASPNRVKRWSSQGLLRVSVPLHARLHYRPWLGAGVTLSQLHALDLSAPPTRTTTSGLLGAGVAVTWPIGKNWFGLLEANGMLLTTRDRYRVDPDGTIGRGPRALFTTLVGVGWGAL